MDIKEFNRKMKQVNRTYVVSYKDNNINKNAVINAPNIESGTMLGRFAMGLKFGEDIEINELDKDNPVIMIDGVM